MKSLCSNLLKDVFRLIAGAVFCTTTYHIHAEEATSSENGVELKISSLPNYPTDKEIRITYVITNKSEKVVAFLDGSFANLKVVLIDPKGQAVIPFPYYPDTNSKSGIEKIGPGRSFTGSFPLQMWFPFDEVGEYRCAYTQRVYLYEKGVEFVEKTNLDGGLMDLAFPEVHFHVESLILRPPRERSMGGIKPEPVLDGLNPIRWYSRHPSKAEEHVGVNNRQTSGTSNASALVENLAQSNPLVENTVVKVKQVHWLLWGVLSLAIVSAIIWLARKQKLR